MIHIFPQSGTSQANLRSICEAKCVIAVTTHVKHECKGKNDLCEKNVDMNSGECLRIEKYGHKTSCESFRHFTITRKAPLFVLPVSHDLIG